MPGNMFGFMKKDKDKDDDRKKKKDKKERKESKRSKDRASLTLDELKRLDEARRSLIGKGRKKKDDKLPSGITADYMEQFRSGLEMEQSEVDLSSAGTFQELRDRYEALASASSLHSDSSSDGVSLRSGGGMAPRPPKRGILKGRGGELEGIEYQGVAGDIDDESNLIENTRQNELIMYENLRHVHHTTQLNSRRLSNGSGPVSPRSPQGQPLSPFISPQHTPKLMVEASPPPTPTSPIPVGESVGHHHTKTFAADLRLPALVPPQAPAPRTLTIDRSPAGDFGFSLRRAQVVERGPDNTEIRRTIVFAEPGTVGRANVTGLLPGDRLLQVNGISVENKIRDEIIELIKASPNCVTLVVQPVAELVELSVRQSVDGREVTLNEEQIQSGTLKRSPSKRQAHQVARSEEQVAAARAWLEAERVWLVHRGGFCAARQLRETDAGVALPEGRVRLKLEHNGDVIEVDEDDVEKANPPPYDRCEDLAQLRYLNESSVLHTLRQRYGSNLIHTYAGAAMVVINPTTPLAIYSEKVIQMFKGCKLEDMPPHIYSAAQASYRDLLATRRDQSVVFLGRSGAGKTTNFRHVLHYLALAAGTTNKILTVEKLNAISTLLEAFGNSRTVMNTNATRFTQIFSLDFDHSGQIASASVQVYMPEKTRVVRRPEGEPNYHIFYQLLSGADSDLRRSLGLENLSEPNLFMTPLQRSEDRQKAGIAWARIRAALDVLSVSPEEQSAIWSVLAAIYHLGTAGATRAATGNKFQFSKPGSAQRAANLLGTSVEELARSIFYSTPTTPSSRASFSSLLDTCDEIIDMIQQAGDGVRTTSPTERPTERPEGLEALEGMATGLYSEAFNAIVALINRCISTSAHTSNSILVVDAPGFQNPASCGRTSGATFQDLCHNYTQERFQMLFHDTTFTAQTDRYAQENIEYGDVADEIGTPAPLIALIDKASSNCVVRTSQVDLRESDRRGLLWLLDEEAIFPGATDQSFLERLYAHYGDREYSQLLKKGASPDQFTLQHFQGTNPVTYSIQNWLRASRENPVMRQAAALLQESNKETLSRLFVFSRGPVSNTISGSVVGIEGSQSLRRASSIRRAFTTGTAGIKRKSVCLQVKFTVDGIIENLRRSKLRFIHCLLPQHNAGLCDLKGSIIMPNKTTNSCEDILLNVPLVRSQLRGCQILDALRLHKQGFPEHLQYSEFRRRFAVLAPAEARSQNPVLDERAAVEAILTHLDLDSSSYRLGLSQIFFRTGAVSRLEEQRDLVLADVITHFQAHCRGHLARKRLEKRKVQETAIRCIQKNVRKFMGVRDWPWWRLLVRVTPLLNVHRTEEDLRATKDELETIRARLEKCEKERTTLKHENEKMEART